VGRKNLSLAAGYRPQSASEPVHLRQRRIPTET
jgi:hypothetical protein